MLNTKPLMFAGTENDSDRFSGVLDTGYSGYGVASKNWVQAYQNYMINNHECSAFSWENRKGQKFCFGTDAVRTSIAQVGIPIAIKDGLKYIWISVIEGNLELLLGRRFLDDFKIIIDSPGAKIKIGNEDWTKAYLNNTGMICLPLLAKEREPGKVNRNQWRKMKKKMRNSNRGILPRNPLRHRELKFVPYA